MAERRRPTAKTDVRPLPEFETYEMRITQGGKIRACVDYALKFFEENEEKALVLHTLPAANKGGSVKIGAGVDADDNDETDIAMKDKKKGLSPSTIAIPRLITVAEIIKREYLLAMDAKRLPDLVGLYQYNEMGCIENGVENEADEETDEGAEDRMKMLADALAGKNIKIERTPYMRITLCRKELAGMKNRDTTAQAPLKRKLSKSARGRLRKRQAKAENGNRE
ncbi:hypothetical protein EDB85DRAFT_615106 [Lactarius pseudohatsudake]|nr:hypothetical protein EDB85DRAFT_1048183 [Lactarius pseudohatsudake]KAH9018495.1 hypothetical protein EDB85DRAFT_615106 [Lactarius pseudohatsudake]